MSTKVEMAVAMIASVDDFSLHGPHGPAFKKPGVQRVPASEVAAKAGCPSTTSLGINFGGSQETKGTGAAPPQSKTTPCTSPRRFSSDGKLLSPQGRTKPVHPNATYRLLALTCLFLYGKLFHDAWQSKAKEAWNINMLSQNSTSLGDWSVLVRAHAVTGVDTDMGEARAAEVEAADEEAAEVEAAEVEEAWLEAAVEADGMAAVGSEAVPEEGAGKAAEGDAEVEAMVAGDEETAADAEDAEEPPTKRAKKGAKLSVGTKWPKRFPRKPRQSKTVSTSAKERLVAMSEQAAAQMAPKRGRSAALGARHQAWRFFLAP